MTLSGDVTRELPTMRGTAESLMTLTLAWYQRNGSVTVVNRMEVPGFSSQGTSPGKVQAASRAGRDTSTRMALVGDTERPVLEAGLHVPLSTVVGVEWEAVVTAVGPRDDPTLLGRRYRVVDVPAKSYATARRLDVVEL